MISSPSGLTRDDLAWLAAFLSSHKQYDDDDDDAAFMELMIGRIADTLAAMP
jgi:hypothetical protein